MFSRTIPRLWPKFAAKLTIYIFYLLTFSALPPPPLSLPGAFARQMHKASRLKSLSFLLRKKDKKQTFPSALQKSILATHQIYFCIRRFLQRRKKTTQKKRKQ